MRNYLDYSKFIARECTVTALHEASLYSDIAFYLTPTIFCERFLQGFVKNIRLLRHISLNDILGLMITTLLVYREIWCSCLK